MKPLGDLKVLLAAFLGVDQDLLHIPIGIVLFVILANLFRRTRRPLLWALVGLLLLQVLNELVDVMNSGAPPGVIWWEEHISDTVLTVYFPWVFMCIVLILTWGVPRRGDPVSKSPNTKDGH